MRKTATRALLIGAIALAAMASRAAAQPAQKPQLQRTPQSWSYNLENGQRVPKGNRVTNPDGSWREEVRQGNCVTVKQKSAAGEYKESRQCDHQ
ncbi:MAG TPA: hypothetical protein VGQ34_06500 [Sphingomicrobium sp.]|jgi:ABC-type sugar transport system substrate-binding protein|nr:hypothetical protein [Sphingomicrobium sp.]